MSSSSTSPITAVQAAQIRAKFLNMAETFSEKVVVLRAAGDDAMADMLDKQIASWRKMAAKSYETMSAVEMR